MKVEGCGKARQGWHICSLTILKATKLLSGAVYSPMPLLRSLGFWRAGFYKDVAPLALGTLRGSSLQRASYRGATRDGKIMAYHVRDGGKTAHSLHFRDTILGKDLPDYIPESTVNLAGYMPNNRGFYYWITDPKLGPRYYRRHFGSEDSEMIFGEGLTGTHTSHGKVSDDGCWMVIEVGIGSSGGASLHLLNLQTGASVEMAQGDCGFRPHWAGDSLVILTDKDAPSRRVMRATTDRPQFKDWKVVVPATDQGPITRIHTFGGRIAVHSLESGSSRIRIYEISGKFVRDLGFEMNGSYEFSSPGAFGTEAGSWSDDDAFVTFSNFTTPPVTWRYNMKTGERTLDQKTETPFHSDAFETVRFGIGARTAPKSRWSW
jgi:prolyl oligopeptidase